MVGNPNISIYTRIITQCLQIINPNFQPDIPVLRFEDFEVKGNSFKTYLNIPNLTTYEQLGREIA